MASNRLYVGNLSYSTTEDDLRTTFSKGGRQVTDVFVVTDRESGRPRGFAFVEMASASDAQSAASELDGAELGGRELKVNEAAERVERDGGHGERKSRGYDRGGNKPSSRGYGSDRSDRGSDRGGNQAPSRGYGSDRGSDKSSGGDYDRKPKENKPRRGAREGDRKPRDF